MKKIKNFFVNNKYLFLTLLCTFFIMLVLFLVKNIFPFGENVFSIGEFDSATLPFYYELWDILHGSGNIFLNFDIGNGINNFSLFVINGFLSPISWVVGLFSRNNIPYVISWLVIIKVLFISLCMFITINKLFPKVKSLYKILFTLIYTFSGWTLLMISNVGYLEVIGLFPLLILGYNRLVRDGKWGLYFVVLLLSYLCNFFIALMITIFIIILTIYSFVFLDIKSKLNKIIRIILVTLMVIGLTSFISFPVIFQMMNSYTLANEIIKSDGFKLFSEKMIHLLPLALPFVLVVKQLFIKKDKKVNLFILFTIITLLLGLFIEPINKIWHLGEYAYFPFKYSFIISGFIILSSLYYLDGNYENENKFNIINLGGVILFIAFTIGLFIYFKDTIMETNLTYELVHVRQFVGLIVIFIISIITFILNYRNDIRIANILVTIYTIMLIGIYGYLYLYNSSVSTSLETQKFIFERMNLPKDNYNYVDNTFKLNLNFSKILNVPSFQSTLEMVDENRVSYRDAFAYSGWGYSIGSSGGTIISDLIMNNKYYFSMFELDDNFYELVDNASGVYLYKSKYSFNNLIPYSGNTYDLDYGDVLKNNNELYKTLFDYDNQIIHIEDLNSKDSIYNLKIEPNNMYYLYVSMDVNDLSDILTKYNIIIDKIIVDNHMVRAVFSTKEKLIIELNEELISEDALSFGYINKEELEEFINEINKFDVNVVDKHNKRTYEFKLNEDSDILIPISYNENYVIKVNGKEIDYTNNVYNMLSVNLDKGDIKLEISYLPKYFKECLIISLISFVGIIVFVFIDKKRTIEK